MPRVLIERYELGPVIGAGGMAKVHLATDRFLDRKVAVKVLDDLAARSADPAARERFLKEARSAAGFAHHNAVSVYDAGQDDDVLFIVMEYIDGSTLATRLADETRLPVRDSVVISIQILEALGAMHERGLLHRDVKPANVLLTAEGRVKLTDFGIAKRLDEIDEALTSAGTVVGTPRYLAPEQAVGGELGAATDVYLTGIVLHEMLTGERPPSVLMGVPSRPPDPRRLRADVPDELADAVMKALEYRPDHRFANAGAMVEALRAAVDDDSSAPPFVATPRAAATAQSPARDNGTRAMPAKAADDDSTQVVTAAADPGDDAADNDVTGESPTTASFPDAERSSFSWALWIPIAAGLLVLVLVGVAFAVNTGDGPGGGRAPAELSTDEFLAQLRTEPTQFGERGPAVRDRLDAVLAETDPAARAAAREALEVDIFVWVADSELDASVGGYVAQVLDR